jgi:hypothetical protein
MSLPVFFPTADVATTLPPGKRFTLRELCTLAGVECRVTGAPAERRLRVGESPVLRAVRIPGPLSEVWLGIPRGNPRSRALKALGLLAYGAFDYGARETLRGLTIARPGPGPGRPSSGFALSAAERQRRYRERLAGKRRFRDG